MADVKLSSGDVKGGFVVYDESNVPVTGLTPGNFTILLANEGVDSAVPVTISEVGDGRYHYAFTATEGEWFLLIRYAVENPRGWSEDVSVVLSSGIVIVIAGTGGASAARNREGLRRHKELMDRQERAAHMDHDDMAVILSVLGADEFD